MEAHRALLDSDAFVEAAKQTSITHASGDCLLAVDAVSRSNWDVLHVL